MSLPHDIIHTLHKRPNRQGSRAYITVLMSWRSEFLQAKPIRRTTVLDVMRRLLQPKNMLVSTTPSKTACYISILNIIQGDVDPTDVRTHRYARPFETVRSQRCASIRSTNPSCGFGNGSWRISFPGVPHRSKSPSRAGRRTSRRTTVSAGSCSPTIPALLQCVISLRTFHVHVPLLTCPMHQLFKRMIDQFDRLRRRNAFVEQYKKEKIFQDGLEEFDDARYAHTPP